MSKSTPFDGSAGSSDAPARLVSPRYLGTLLLTAIAYWIVAKLSLKLAFLQDNSSPVWPPSGLAIGLTLVMRYRYVPAILLGAFLVNLSTFQAALDEMRPFCRERSGRYFLGEGCFSSTRW